MAVGAGGLDEIGLRAVIEGVGAYLANLDKIEKGEKDAAKAAAEVENKSKAMGAMLTKASLLGTTALVGLGAVAVKFAMDFENQMDQVGAVLQASDEDMVKLKETAKKLGADTAFSAGEAAKAMEELAAGGRSVAQIIGGEAKAAVDLAAAGNYDLANSARTIATTMDIWKDTQIETNDVVNRLAGAANSSRFGVEDMSQAIASGGGVAATAGVSFQDFSTVIAATASAFNSGSDAGTSFKTFITSLSGNSEKAKDMIKELGLEFYTTAGTLKPMSEIVNQLNVAMAGLSQEQQTVALKTIFGNDAFRTAAGLMKMTGDEFTAMSNKMRDTDASSVAADRMSNLSGTLEQLQGSLETLAIATGERVLPVLNEMAKVATTVVNGFSALPASTQNLILMSTAFVTMIPLILKGAESAKKFVDMLRSLELQTMKTKLALGAGVLAGALVAVDLGLQALTGKGLMEHLVGLFEKTDYVAEAAAESLEKFNIQTERLTNAEKLELAVQALDGIATEMAAIAEIPPLTDTLRLPNGYEEELQTDVLVTKEMKSEVLAMAAAMDANGASVSEMIRVHDSLPPALKAAFEAGSNWSAVLLKLEEGYKTHKVAEDEAIASLKAERGAREEVKETVEVTKTALDDFNDSLAEEEAATGKAVDRAKEFNKVLDDLAGRFNDFNPQVIAARGELAAVDEELADLERSGGEWSETLGQTKDQLIENKKRLEDFIGAGEENEKAIKGMRDELKLYVGEGLLNLESALANSKLSLEDQENAEIGVAKALRALSNDDVPGFVKALDEVEKKAPGMAAVVVENLGPGLSTKLKENLPELYATGSALAGSIADGLVQGLDSAQNRISGTGRGIVRALMTDMADEAKVDSPSKLTYQYGVWIMKGFEGGMEDAAPDLRERAVELVRDVFVDLKEETDAGITSIAEMIDPGGTSKLSTAAASTVEGFINTMQTNLDVGHEMTQAQLGEMFDSMYNFIANSDLPEAAKKAAEGVITAWVMGIGAGTGLANQAVIDYWTTLKGTIAQEGASAIAEQKAIMDVLSGGGTFTLGADGKWYPTATLPKDFVGTIGGSSNPAPAPLDKPSQPGTSFNQTVQDPNTGSTWIWNGSEWVHKLYPSFVDSKGKTVFDDQYQYIQNNPGLASYAHGTPYIDRDQLAWIHRGEAVVPAWANPYNGTSRPAQSGIGGGTNISINLSGAHLTGTIDENRRMLYDVVTDVIKQENGYQSAIAGVSRD